MIGPTRYKRVSVMLAVSCCELTPLLMERDIETDAALVEPTVDKFSVLRVNYVYDNIS
jgi:hypothetical protein